jgi:uncharacterized protein
MLVICDTSSVTALIQIGRDSLLPTLFGEVRIPSAVDRELRRFHSSLPPFLGVQEVRDTLAVELLTQDLDCGEAEAIVLAEEVRADYLLIDEKLGRSTAESRGLKVMGLLGVLLIAKKSGHITSVKSQIAELEALAGFYVSSSIKRFILTSAGEGE